MNLEEILLEYGGKLCVGDFVIEHVSGFIIYEPEPNDADMEWVVYPPHEPSKCQFFIDIDDALEYLKSI